MKWLKFIVSNRHLRVNLILIILTFVVVATVAVFSTKALLQRDREINTQLYFDILRQTVDEAFVKPLQVTKTMERDSFLRDFLKEEKAKPSEAYSDAMGRYLSGISSDEEWSGAYFSSAKTMNYYDSHGFAKVIDPEADPYDLWYTNFVESGEDYDIDVEYDQLNNEVWTVFLDKRMEDENHELLGVCTVAMEMDTIQRTIERLESNYDVRIFFAEKDGTICVASSGVSEHTDFIPEELSTEEFTYNRKNAYAISQYIPLLDWYLVVENTHQILQDLSRNLLMLVSSIVLILILSIIFINLRMTIREQSILNGKAETDALTQILNRGGLERCIKAQMNTGGGGTLFMVDMDHLKDVNDSFGHDIGDEALIQTAVILKKAFRANDIIGRLGGDEFVVYSPGILERDIICKKAGLLETMGKREVQKDSRAVQVSLSVGIAVCPKHGSNYPELLRKADKALYAAKDAGRGCYRIYEGS